MPLINEVKAVCKRLDGTGWGALLRRHGLRLGRTDLAAELARDLPTIDRSIAGFEDFTSVGRRGIEPGKPAASLLYHALASPNVHPTRGGAAGSPELYPTLADLDVIENYIYSLARFELDANANLVIAVFAYQYRPATCGAHIWHADMAFSRTGVARVGTSKPFYDPPSRGFKSDSPKTKGMPVSPARYGAFLGRVRRAVNVDPVMGRRDKKDRNRAFVFPVHKLFSGSECIVGRRLTVNFQEFHVNEKLRRVHVFGKVQAVAGFNVNAFPFVRDSSNGGRLVSLERKGASVLVVPRPSTEFVETAEQYNSKTRKLEVARFVVPPRSKTGNNRYSTSLRIVPKTNSLARLAPEYVNIRHRVDRVAGRLRVVDMRTLPEPQFSKETIAGGYEAAHFSDQTCDGALVAVVTGVGKLTDFCAYSLVTAPDFFPLADEMEITNWVREDIKHREQQFSLGAPWPLCEGREAANLELPRPGASGARRAFDRHDVTVAAVVANQPLSRDAPSPARQKRFSSFLPDAASNVFAPGWDVSLGQGSRGNYYAAYGLGSPFPEDSKLCAALNSFWPAVAPDASRTFNAGQAPTAMPLLDSELGFHPGHPRVKAGAVASHRGWDGEYGPFLETVGGNKVVNTANFDRSDYVTNSLVGMIGVRLTAPITAADLIERMETLRRCVGALPPAGDIVSETKLLLVTAEKIADWAIVRNRASKVLLGAGFRFVFVRTAGAPVSTADLTRLRTRVGDEYECHIAATVLFFRQNGAAWTRVKM